MPAHRSLRSVSLSLAVTASLSCGLLSVGTGFASAAPVPPGAGASAEHQASPGQGPVAPVPGAKSSFSATAAGPTITRSEVIDRAKTWVGIGLDYSWTGSHNGYRTDCSGYVSMAWRLGTSLTTDTFAGAGVIESISKGELKAGDALLNDNSGANGHVVLFEKWANSSHTSYIGYEFTSSGVHHREIPYPYYSGYGTFLPVRNKSVIDDVVVPADPGMTSLTAGEFTGDSKGDLVAVEVETGKLWLYRGPNVGSKSSRTEIGTGGWNGMTNLAAGDLNHDGKDDLVATEKSTGKLFLYKGNGTGLTSRTEIGTGGWNGMTNVFAGDFNGDGIDDIGATEKSTGKLYLYKGNGNGTITGIGGRTEIGTGGWNGISGLAAADFTGDGTGDIAAVESHTGETGKLYLYKGTGTGTLTTRTEIGTGGW